MKSVVGEDELAVAGMREACWFDGERPNVKVDWEGGDGKTVMDVEATGLEVKDGCFGGGLEKVDEPEAVGGGGGLLRVDGTSGEDTSEVEAWFEW